MKAYEVITLVRINATDPTHVAEIAKSIEKNGWQGCPILYSGSFGMLVTGSHRAAALELLEDNDFDIDSLGEVAEDVDDIIDAWCEENDCSHDDIKYDYLREIFGGTWVEEYKDEIAEW